MKAQTYFKDESCFNGIREFNSPIGKLKATYEFSYWSLYRFCEESGYFIFLCYISGKARQRCKTIYNVLAREKGFIEIISYDSVSIEKKNTFNGYGKTKSQWIDKLLEESDRLVG